MAEGTTVDNTDIHYKQRINAEGKYIWCIATLWIGKRLNVHDISQIDVERDCMRHIRKTTSFTSSRSTISVG
ncbi:putative type I inositol polyphosphate 5-phosphatase 4-like [Sesbania bispinosa]|nr:putative type I inositol polyphosphate 5-phosphatase 4-like [Sesbania bispinosa]